MNALRLFVLIVLVVPLPQSFMAAAPSHAAGRRAEVATLRSDVLQALPAWFASPDAADEADVLPDWFALPGDLGPSPAPSALPDWFPPLTSVRASSTQSPPTQANGPPFGSQTIYANQVTVTLTPQTINLCDPLTVTIVAANNAVTTTGVAITAALPGGFNANLATFNVGTVAPNAVITQQAVFTSTCGAVSGQVVVTLTQDAHPPIVKLAEYVVNPGAITVRKEPAVAPAAIGDVVTWTVFVDSTGYGTVYNVRVTDTLGPGLQLVSGITSATFVSIPVGQSVSFTVAAQVVACSGLENSVAATWGCNGGACLAPQTAKASIDLQPRFPDLDYALPPFNVNYCGGGTVFTIPITNTGDGTAYSVTLPVNLSPFSVTVSAPATYTAGAFQLPPIPPGQTFNLVFTLTTPANVCAAPLSGSFDFDVTYRDACNFFYTEAPQAGAWQLTNTPGQLSLSKSAPGEVYRGQLITTPITVNAGGVSGTVIVTDQVPAGFAIVSTGGGVSFTLGGVTYITWAVTGSTTLTPVFVVSNTAGTCALCGQALTNVVTATLQDCRACQQTATAQSVTYLQCDDGVQSQKLVSAPAAVCSTPAFTYTNIYTFAPSFAVTPTWSSLIFTEALTNQSYVTGSAQVWVGNGPISCTATFSQAIIGGQLVITNITPPCNPNVAGATLVITYTTAAGETNSCSNASWYDWSYLNLGVSGNSVCSGGDVIAEGVFVETLAPQMTLSASGLPPNVAACGVYTVTLTAQRTSSVGAYDAVIVVPTGTYAVLDVRGFGGATPVFTQTDSTGYRWFYSDTFTAATTATVQLRVQLRCGGPPAPLQGTIHYESLCSNNDTYYERCNAGGTLAAPLRLAPLPLLTKFPERIYATGDVVTWTLIAKNTGAGPAYSLVLTDALGSGLRFATASITSSLGSVAGITLITSTNLVTWEVPVIQPKEALTIKYAAEIIGCTDLTNRFSGVQGCLGQVCLGGGPVTSVVELPPTVLLNTNQTFSPLDTCYTRTVTATVRNAGLLSVYSATVTETLPAGLFYVAGTTEVSTDTLSWQPGPEPAISGSTLSWGPSSGAPLDAWLARVRPGETVYVRFVVRASCGFQGGQLRIQTGYRDTCGNPYLTDSSSFLLAARQAELSLSKVGQNLSRTSPSDVYLYGEPGDVVVFTVTVSNAGGAAPAQLLVISDALPSNLVFVSATPGYSGPVPGPLGGTITWSLPLLNPGSSVVFTVTAVVSQPNGCTLTDTFNTAAVSWGCPDGCRLYSPAQQVRIRTRPVFDAPGIAAEIAPNALNVCGGAVTLTLRNDGPPAYNVVLTNALPGGYVFSDTLLASTLPSGTLDLGGSVVYTWGVLPSGFTTITLRVRNANSNGTCALAGGPFTATLLYDDDAPDCPDSGPYTATASVALTAQAPALAVSKSPNFQFATAGQTVTWTVRVTNTGSGTASNVVITDVAGSAFTNITATNGAAVSGNTLTWTLATLPPAATFSAIVTAVVTETGVNRNVVTATAQCDGGCLAAQGTTVAYVTLNDAFDKGPAVQTGTIGSLVVFTFTGATNDTDNIFDQARLTDTLPIGLGYVAATLAYTVDVDGSQGGPTATFNVAPTVAPAPYASGNIAWNLGALTGAVQFNGVVTAVIQDIPQSNHGAVLTNTLLLTFVDDGQFRALTDTAQARTVEPLLHLGKRYLTPYGCSSTLLEDDFNRPNATPPTGWSNVAGAWSNEAGVVVRTGGSATDAILVRSGFTAAEYSYSAIVSTTDDTASAGLIFHHTAGGHYRLRLRLSDGGTNLQLQEISGTATTNLATTTFTPTVRRWYHLEAQVEETPGGLRIRGYVDGQLLINVVDPTPRTPGSVGFYSNNCLTRQCAFDDALVTRLNRAGCFVGAGDAITYTLTVSNQGVLPGYDLLITDVIPYGTSLLTYTLSTNDSSGPALLAAPSPGATGALTWRVSHLTPTLPFTSLQHTALTLTVVLSVAPSITANVTLSNHAFLRYDAWLTDTQPISSLARGYSGGSHAAAVQTADAGIAKSVQFAPPPTATLGTLVTYTLFVPATPITAVLYNALVTDTLDPRLFILAVTFTGGLTGSVGVAGQQVTATFGAIPASAQALITVTARLSHEFPGPATDPNAGDVITNLARLSHSTAPVTPSNVVSTTVGEPNLLLSKHVESSSGVTVGLDGLAYLTYTLRLTNTGSSPAYAIYVTDALPGGISVTALFGGDAQSAPAAGPGVITWFVSTLSNVAPANVIVLSYTARISQALLGAALTNTVAVLYHSLTDTIPGVRPYTTTATATVSAGGPTIAKQVEPSVIRVGDLITYRVVFTIPAGAAWGGASGDVLLDALPPGVWYITDSETLAHTPAAVNVTLTQRISNTTEQPGQQVIRWSFAPITSAQDAPTVVTLTFQAQAVGLRIDTLAPVWITQTDLFYPTNYAQLEYPWPNHVSATATSAVIQPRLALDKDSTPPPGSVVGAGDLITYRLTITNDGHGPAYDIVISDVLPAGLALVTATLSANAPPTAAFLAQPPVSATGTLTWQVSALWGLAWNSGQPGVAVITVVAQVSAAIGANLTLTNTATLPGYDSQPGDGPGPYAPDERSYSDGSDAVSHRTADATLLKSVTPPTATLGSVVTYVLVVPEPPITSALYAVTVTDQLDARVQLHSVNAPGGSAVVVGSAFTVTFASIPAGEQRLITVTAVVSSPLGANAGDVLTNVATLRHQDGGPTLSNQTQVTVTEPALALLKASQPPSGSVVGAGQLVTYTVRLTNANGVTVSAAYDLVFSDTLPLHMRAAPPVLIGLTLDGAALGSGDYLTSYEALSGHFAITFGLGISLPPGSALVITYTAQVDADAPPGAVEDNLAAAGWSSLPGPTPGERDYGPITDTTRVQLGQSALDLSKSAPFIVQAGELLTYTLTVTNSGLVSATGVVITDLVPANTGYVSCGPAPCGESGGVVSWTLGALDVGASRVVTLVVQVTSPLPNGTPIVNTAHVTSSHGVTDTDTATTTVGSAPVLLLSKQSVDANGAPLQPGDVLSYVIVVQNAGNAVANAVTVSDSLPAHTGYVPGSIAGGDANSDAALPLLSWTINTLPPGAPVTLSFAVTVHLPLTNGLVLSNTASVTSTEVTTPTSATVTDTVVSSLALQVTKSAEPEPATAGGLLTYTLRYTLTGDAPALGVALSDTTPAHTTFFTAIPPPTSHPGLGNSGPVVWQLGDLLPPGSGVTQAVGMVTLVVQISSPLPNGTQIVNTALLSETGGLTSTDTTTSTVTSSHALSVTKVATPPVATAGGVLTYTLHYTVGGNAPAPAVVVTDTLPPSVTVQSCAPACGVGGNVVTWSLGTLNPPANGALTVVVSVASDVPTGTLLTNVVVIGDGSGLTDTDSIDTPTQALAELMLHKTATPTVVEAGAVLTYALVVTNAGPSDAQNVVVTDTLPPEVSLLATTPPASGVSGDVITWALGALPAGQSAILTVTVLVSPALPSGALITNTATASTSTAGDDPANNTDVISTPVQARAEVALHKHSDTSITVPGATVTFTLHIANFGPSVAQNVIVTDTLDSQMVYLSATPAPNSVSGSILTWLLGDLSVGQHVVITVVVRISPLATYGVLLINNAVVTTDTPGDDPANNISDWYVTPVQPTVAIQKQLVGYDTDLIAPNFITFTIRVTNTGPSAITTLRVVDQFDDGVLSYTHATPAPNVIDPGELRWDDLTAAGPHGFGAPLLPGQSYVITVTFRVITDIVSTTNYAVIGEGTRDAHDNPTNEPSDQVEVIGVPTAVTLRAFYVSAVSGRQVTLAWETETEQDNFAFRLYRAPANDFGQAVLIASVPAAMGGTSGASYAYVDTAPDDGVWWYWLADVDTAGRETVHRPPVQARVGLSAYRLWLPVVMRAE